MHVVPNINTITKYINQYLDEYHDRLNLSIHNEKTNSLDKCNVNNLVKIKNNNVNKTPTIY